MDTQYTRRLDKIEAVLRRSLPETLSPQWIQDTFTLTTSKLSNPAEMALPDPGQTSFLTTPAVDLLQRGGKRWRPLLMTLVCETLGGGDEALELAPLVEFPHNGSLIHDDIEDNSDERAGQERDPRSLRRRYGHQFGELSVFSSPDVRGPVDRPG